MPRLLVVDDNLGTRETYSIVLRAEGYDIDAVECGAAAVAYLSTAQRPNGILLDQRLGDMTGCDVLRWMQRERKMSPTAILTAFRGGFDPDEAIALGALAFSEQPLEPATLTALARSLTTPPSVTDHPSRLHSRLIAGDPGALECLGAIFLEKVPPRLQHVFPRNAWDLAIDACVDATLEYGAAPQRFDATRGTSVIDFIYHIGRRNLQNALAAEASRKERERRWGRERIRLTCGPRESRHRPDVWSQLRLVLFDMKEERAAVLWMQDADLHTIAMALGARGRPVAEQRAEVHRFIQRIMKRLSRLHPKNLTAEVSKPPADSE